MTDQNEQAMAHKIRCKKERERRIKENIFMARERDVLLEKLISERTIA